MKFRIMMNFLRAVFVSVLSAYIPAETACDEHERMAVSEMSLDTLLNIRINSAAKYAQTILEAPSSVTIITSQDIANYGYTTLAEVLDSVRGFYTSNDRNYFYAGVRGFGRPTDYNNRILLQINGNTINENIFGSAFIETMIPVNEETVERIEIIRGPGSALYGANAMFAVVNIIPKKGSVLNSAAFAQEIGNNGRLRSSAAYGTETVKGLDVLFSGTMGGIEGSDHYYHEFNDPATNNGIAAGIDNDRHYNVMSAVTYGDFSLFGIVADRSKEIPTAAWETDFNSDEHTTTDNLSSFSLTWNKAVSRTKNLKVRGFYNRYRFKAGYPYYDDPEVNALFKDSALGEWIGGEVLFTLDTGPHNRIVIGSEYRDNTKAHYKYREEKGTVWYDNDSPFRLFSAYVQDTYQFRHDLSATVGIRSDKYSSEDIVLSPRIALIYNPYYTSTLKALYGYAFRPPNVYESNYEEPDYWKRNDDLTAETVTTTELIWEQRLTGNLMSTVSAYVYNIKDMIDTEYDSSTELFYYDNTSEAYSRGFELGFESRYNTVKSYFVNYSYQETMNRSTHTRLTNSPAHLVKCGITIPLGRHFYSAGVIRYESERKTIYGTSTGSTFITNLNLSTNKIRDHAKFSLSVRNVFDVRYYAPGGYEHVQDSIRQDGRLIVFSVHLYN